MRNLLIAVLALAGCVDASVGTPPVGGDDTTGNENPAQDPGSMLDDQTGPTTGNAAMVSFDLTESDDELFNPERGYYSGWKITESDSVGASVRARGHSLVLTNVRLDAYRDQALDSVILDKMRAHFSRVRAAGLKVILRFAYNSCADCADASKARIIQHIGQVAPIIQDNVDVIALMQGGFIGEWGEWHGSTNGLDNDDDRRDILDAMLAALPPSRGVNVRAPMHVEGAFPGGAITAAEAYSGTPRSRIGHHNDCFLSSVDDYRTFASPVDQWRMYVADDGQFNANGGETCNYYAPRSECAAAIDEMNTLNWSYLNSSYNMTVLNNWETQGCGAEVRNRLGYRYSVVRVAHTERVAPGGSLDVAIDVRNTGFASPYNRRPVEIVLRNGDVRLVAKLTGRDVRTWAKGETMTLTARLRLPANAPTGAWELALRLPDDAASLANDSRYSIQLANEGAWRADTGDNVLSDAVLVEDDAPGPRDPSATTFAELD